MFADDSKLYKYISDIGDCDVLLQECQNVYNWCQLWLMKLNVKKCKKLTLCTSKLNCVDFNYGFCLQSNDHNQFVTIENVESMSDLGVTIDNKLNFSVHIYDKINKAYRLLGLIKRVFSNITKEVFITLYKSLVRTQLEYANPVFNPSQKGLIADLEKVQKRATKMIPECRNLPYNERLNFLGLPTLKYRRYRGDMIEMYKLAHNYYDECVCPKLKFNHSTTRGHKYKLEHLYSRLNIRKHSFFVRSVGIWNALPEAVVDAPSINSFKSLLDKAWSNESFLYDWEGVVPGSNL